MLPQRLCYYPTLCCRKWFRLKKNLAIHRMAYNIWMHKYVYNGNAIREYSIYNLNRNTLRSYQKNAWIERRENSEPNKNPTKFNWYETLCLVNSQIYKRKMNNNKKSFPSFSCLYCGRALIYALIFVVHNSFLAPFHLECSFLFHSFIHNSICMYFILNTSISIYIWVVTATAAQLHHL